MLNLLLTQKWEENIRKFYFFVGAPKFWKHMPCPLKIGFTKKFNTICGGGQLLVTGSQGLGCQDPMAQGHNSQGPGSQFQSPRVLSLKIPGSQVLGLRFPSLGSQGSRSWL